MSCSLRALAIALASLYLVFSQPSFADSVNINTADAATLARGLAGIGETRARAIVEYRTSHGPFKSIDELALVKGIGPRAIEQNRERIRLDRPAATKGVAPAKPEKPVVTKAR